MTTDHLATLLAGLDADERIARAADGLQCDTGWACEPTAGSKGFTIHPHIGHIHEVQAAEHAVRHGPDRALRQADAYRKVLAGYRDAVDFLERHQGGIGSATILAPLETRKEVLEEVIAVLADIYTEEAET